MSRHHAVVLLWLLQYARRYFAPTATDELLRLLRPQLTPGSPEIYTAQSFLVRFLPSNHLDLIALWLPDVMTTWAAVQHLPDWDTQWLTFVARYAGVSRDRPSTGPCWVQFLRRLLVPAARMGAASFHPSVAEDHVGTLDWSPYLGFIYSVILQSFGVTVGSNRPTPVRQHELPQHCNVFLKLPFVRDRVGPRLLAKIRTS